MRSLIVGLCLLFASTASAEVQVYGPQKGFVNGSAAYPIMMSTFRTGLDPVEVTKIVVGNARRGSRDVAYLCELNSNFEIVSFQPLQYYMFTATADLGTLNFYKTSYMTILKPRTRYGILWYSGSNSQAWTTFSGRMQGSKNTGYTQGRNFVITDRFENLNANLLVILYGNEQ